MSRPVYLAGSTGRLFVALLGVFSAFGAAASARRSVHGIQAAPRAGRAGAARAGRALAVLTPEVALNKPVVVVVHTYWGEQSCFNTQLRLDCAMSDTGLSIKHKIEAETGAPVRLQKLFVSDSVWTLSERTPFADRDRVSEYYSLLRLRHDTKELQLNVVLELPAPLCHRMRADPLHRGEYLSALRRYSALLGRVKAARKDPRLMLDPGQDREEVDTSDSITTVQDSIASDTSHLSQLSLQQQQPPPAAPPPGEAYKKSFVRPNHRMHLLFFHDLPPAKNVLSYRVAQWLHRQFPIDWYTSARFALMCYMIRETCDNDPWVNELLLYVVPASLFCQTRLGWMMCRSILHALPTHLLPKVITNVLPAQIAQQLG